MKYNFYIYLAVMAVVTYLIRLIPILFVRKKTKNRFINSFLSYMPSAVLSVMTVPAIFYSTNFRISAIVGFGTALLTASLGKTLMQVAAISCLSVFLVEIVIKYI